MNDYECGDCQYNMGDNGRGCHCEVTGALIDICRKACNKFLLQYDLEEE